MKKNTSRLRKGYRISENPRPAPNRPVDFGLVKAHFEPEIYEQEFGIPLEGRTAGESAGRGDQIVLEKPRWPIGASSNQGQQGCGTRAEVTGGKHLNQVLVLLCKIAAGAGFNADEILFNVGVELPGYFRPQKRWDVIITRKGRLCAAIELKSQAGSFGNNFNNRSEEAIGGSTDFWTAFREGALGPQAPWLGYLFLLEKADGSTRPIGLKQGLFPPFGVFKDTSYAQRYAILCERLVLERKYSCASLILSSRGKKGDFEEPNPSLGFYAFAKSLHGHLVGCT